jgi:hypothetical protein
MRKYMRINNTGQSEVRNYLRNKGCILSRVVGLAHLCVGGLPGDRLRKRTPVPPPFSSMNSTPASFHQVWQVCWKRVIGNGLSDRVKPTRL